MGIRNADGALFRRIGKMRDSGKSLTEIAKAMNLTLDAVAQSIWKYDHTVTKIEHGTVSAYQYYGCRCVPCTTAATDRGASRRDYLREHPELVTHGTFTGYYTIGCRCEECSAFGDPRLAEYNKPLVEGAPRNREEWTDREYEIVGDYSKTAKEIAAQIGRTPSSVKAARRRMWRKEFAV